MELGLDEVRQVEDGELVCRLERLVRADRALSVEMLVRLGEVHERKLYVGRGYSSMFEYCRSALGMSEGEAALRIKAAKVGRCFPLVLERLGAGAVHLSAIKLLAPVLTAANHVSLLDRARGKSKRQIELIVAELLPKADVPARLRRLPDARAPLTHASSPSLPLAQSSLEAHASPAAPGTAAVASVLAAGASQVPPVAVLSSPEVLAPAANMFVLQSPRLKASTSVLRPGRFKLEVTLGEEAYSKLEQLRELLRHQNPTGDLTVIVERALSELLERTMKKRFGQTNAPKRRVARELTRSTTAEGTCSASAPAAEEKRSVPPTSRYIPRDVLRAVHARDRGRCTFVSSDGRRCTERGFLEVHHHETTFARGGAATSENLRLVCRAHNLFFAEQDYGREYMQRKLREAVDHSADSGPSAVTHQT